MVVVFQQVQLKVPRIIFFMKYRFVSWDQGYYPQKRREFIMSIDMAAKFLDDNKPKNIT